MKRLDIKFLTLSLLILLAQNSLSINYVVGTGSVASDESVAVGISWTSYDGVVHKNIAGNESNPSGKYYATAIGIANEASGEYSSAFGRENAASGEYSSAFGYRNEASRMYSSAFGRENTASGSYSSAFGVVNRASGERSSAFGLGNIASGYGSSAFGYANTASGNNSIVSGSEYEVSGENSGAFGVGEISGVTYLYKNEGKNSYMIGNYNKIAAGTENNFILGNNASIGAGINNSVALGNNSTVSASNEVSVGSSTLRRKITNVADGTNNNDVATWGQVKTLVAASGGGGTPIDLSSYTKRDASNLSATDVNAWKAKLGVGSGGGGTPVDAYTKTESDNKYATKTTVYTKSETDNKLGDKADRDGSNLTASDIVSWKAKLAVASVGSVANTATGTGSTGLGHGNTVSGNYSTAVGYKNNVTGNNSGAFGDPNVVSGNRSYAFGNDNNIAGDDNFVMGSNVTIGAGITNSVALGNNSTVSASNEVSVGSSTNKRKITNVADGELSATSTDAVTGKQLYNAMQNSAGIENLRNEVNNRFADVKSEINHVGSLSAALAALHPMQYDPQAPNQIMAGFGHYRNKQAVAVGMSHYFSDNVLMTAGFAIGSERRVKTMANVGIAWKIGKGGSSSATNTPQYIMQDEMSRLAKENNQLKSQLNAQAKEIEIMKEQLKQLMNKK